MSERKKQMLKEYKRRDDMELSNHLGPTVVPVATYYAYHISKSNIFLMIQYIF